MKWVDVMQDIDDVYLLRPQEKKLDEAELFPCYDLSHSMWNIKCKQDVVLVLRKAK